MNSGSLTFKVESRDAYTRIPPQDLGINAGAMSITSAQFSDAGLILTNLYWKQRFMDDRLTIGFGQMDVTDYSDIYPLANPVSAFQNLAFSVSPSIPFPSQGLALAAGFWFSDNVYSIAGIADANGDPSSPDFDVFDTGETFQHVEVGITSSRERQYLDNFHVTLWNQDARKMQGIPEDRGVSVSTNWVINDSFVPFLRAGWSDKGTALHQKSVSTGIGYLTPWHDLLGMGFNWGSAAGLNEQWTMEAFYRYQVSESLALTFDVQQVWNPALNPDQDRIGFYNMRLRLAF
jgi:porin